MPESVNSKPVRVLIVDDEEDDFILTSSQIKDITTRTFAIEWCSNYKKAVERIGKSEHDIYFIDYRLGAKTGLDLLKEPAVQHNEQPVILLTGQGNQAIDLEAMRLGAVDYLIKSELNPEKLERCIRYSLERSAILKASRASERKYRNIFEKTRDVIFLSDHQLTIININEVAVSLFDLERNLLIGRSIYDLLSDEKEKVLLARKLAEEKSVDDFQIELISGNQERKIALISASLEIDSEGMQYVQGMIQDITLLKRAEEITLEAEKLEAKGNVVRTLAHEIRNPLNNISVSIDQLKAGISEEDQELLSIVYRGVKRIDDLINELMDSSRYFKMKFRVLSLQSVVDRAIEDAQDRIALKKIKLELNYPTIPASALLDLEKIKIAFLNIILNAVEAMEEGKGVLTITIISSPVIHKVIIGDNGCGMNEETTSRLFEPYFTSKPNGVGLGLASAIAIIQSHKSTISLVSKVNEGTVFTISFPAL
ncbi:MAG: response regulator [Cyclobacteriaceae bacterium]|nr:response regulator [Cyclobacteriaceae bacterium]